MSVVCPVVDMTWYFMVINCVNFRDIVPPPPPRLSTLLS